MRWRWILGAVLVVSSLYLGADHTARPTIDAPAPTFAFPTDAAPTPTLAPTPAPTPIIVRPRPAPTIDTDCLDVDCFEPCDELAGDCDDIDAGYALRTYRHGGILDAEEVAT